MLVKTTLLHRVSYIILWLTGYPVSHAYILYSMNVSENMNKSGPRMGEDCFRKIGGEDFFRRILPKSSPRYPVNFDRFLRLLYYCHPSQVENAKSTPMLRNETFSLS